MHVQPISAKTRWRAFAFLVTEITLVSLFAAIVMGVVGGLVVLVNHYLVGHPWDQISSHVFFGVLLVLPVLLLVGVLIWAARHRLLARNASCLNDAQVAAVAASTDSRRSAQIIRNVME